MSICGYINPAGEKCEVDGHRPYDRKGTLSATTVLGIANLGDKASKFSWAAAEIAAVTAVHEQLAEKNKGGIHDCMRSHKLCAVCGGKKMDHDKDHRFLSGLCGPCTFLRSEFWRQWDRKAKIGTHAHHLAASWAAGEEVESDPVIDPYLNAVADFYTRHHPRWLATERTVCYRTKARSYVGTFDGVVEIDCPVCMAALLKASQAQGPTEGYVDVLAALTNPPRCRWLIDLKTGEGKWQMEWALQLSAYRYSKYLTRWVDGVERKDGRMPLVSHTGVIWLKETGEAELVPVETNGETFNRFLGLLDFAEWAGREEKRLKDEEKAA